MTEEAVAPCSLLLEVFEAASIYEDDLDTVAWSVSTDPDHPFPYLLAPRNYAEQEIDPIRCTASIGTVEVGVVDVPTTPGDQTTGWMTARVHDMLGRRCRLRRFINDTIGWVTVADGPAGFPKMDASYAAYRWTIRDTRETERKLKAFAVGGVTSIVPRGSIYGFGSYTDDDGDHLLLPATMETPIVGEYQISAAGDLQLAVVNFSGAYLPGPSIPDKSLMIDEDGQTAVEISELLTNVWGARNADVLWRVQGDTDWNVSRPTGTTAFRQPFVGTADVTLDGEPVQAINYVTLWVAENVPDGFPTVSGANIEVIVRYRGVATENYPYYVEGPLGEVLQALYEGQYSLAPLTDIAGSIYDPAELDTFELNTIPQIRFDSTAFDAMVDHVCLRQTSIVDDARTWTETALYAPSGWIPALNNDMEISPISRNRPESIDNTLVLDDIVTVPAPNWQTGERTVSAVVYRYNRYFVPAEDSDIEVAADGLATREVEIDFVDPESELRYGSVVEEYDATAFSSVGTEEGVNLPGGLEPASIMCQTAKFEVLDRYRAGVEGISVSVRRSRIPNVRAGDWVPWELVHLPNKQFGLRGSSVPAAQILSLRDDDCVWRVLTLESGETSAGAPGTVVLLEKVGDEPGAGEAALMVDSDEESY